MARVLTHKDAHSIMNLLVKEATGQDATIQVVDSSTFVSASETVLSTGVENTLNSLSLVIGRTFAAVRPYKAKLLLINSLNTGVYSSRVRKISYYARESQASGYFNTDLNTNFANGYDNGTNSSNSTASMWEQNQPQPLEVNFAGSSTWQDSTTVYENKLQYAFANEDNFNEFIAGIMTEKANDIESQKEAFNRMTLLNHIAGVADLTASMPGSYKNLTSLFNAKFGTSYTSAQLRTTYLKEFLEFFVATFKLDSDRLTNRTNLFHWTPTRVGYTLLRHTPKDKQRAILYSPFFTDATAMVLPEIFSPQYLGDISKQGELVDYWQNINEPSEIDVTPGIPDTSTGQQTAGANVKIEYLLGCLYDEDAIMTDYQLEASYTTPLEARKGYRNIWWTFAKNAINDFTENFIVYYMAD